MAAHKAGSSTSIEVEYFRVDSWAAGLGIRALRRFLLSSELARELRRTIRHFDLVHIHYIFHFPSLVSAGISRRTGVPYIVSLYGNLDPYMHAKNRLLKDVYLSAIARRALNRAAAIHLMSEGERRMVQPFGLTSPQMVVDLGIDTSKYCVNGKGRFRAAHPELKSRKIVAYLGRLSYTKGLDLLAEAFRIVARADPNTHLVFIGPDDGYGETLRRLLGRDGLIDRVTFTGRVPEADKISALVDADVFAFPSYTEAFGLAMLEAMACELPVILTDRAALAGDMAAQGAALVVQPEAPALAEGLMRLLNDVELRRQLGAAARSLITTRFSWPAVAERFLEMYKSVLPTRPELGCQPIKA
jgi:glycosyltransferase involved in cell wall biosynthesis